MKGEHDAAVPSGNTAHEPSRPVCAHDSQAPLQVRSQHRPWAQIPLAHGTPGTHGWPVAIVALPPPCADPPALPPPWAEPPAVEPPP
jgi:hypothetical protein